MTSDGYKMNINYIFVGISLFVFNNCLQAQSLTVDPDIFRLNKPKLAEVTWIKFDISGSGKGACICNYSYSLQLKSPILSKKDGDYLFKIVDGKGAAFQTNFKMINVANEVGHAKDAVIGVVGVQDPCGWITAKLYRNNMVIFSVSFEARLKSVLQDYAIVLEHHYRSYSVSDWGKYGPPDEAQIYFKDAGDANWQYSSDFDKSINKWCNYGRWEDSVIYQDDSGASSAVGELRLRYGFQWLVYGF